MRYLQNKESEKIELDLKDKKILLILSNNCRTPFTIIAKKVGLSRDAVAYRIKNLEEKGLIQGYRTVVNINKFSCFAFHIFIQLKQPDKEAEEKIIKRIQRYNFVRAILKFNGKYDFEIALIAKNMEEFDRISEVILKDFGKFIQDYEILILTKDYISSTFPKSFFEDKEFIDRLNNGENMVKESEKIKFDIKDIGILKGISNKASIPLYELADNLKISADSVAYRIKNMVKFGIIQKFVPVINHSSINYSNYAVLLRINNFENNEEKIKSFLEQDKNILWATKTVGKYNLLLYLLVKNTEDLHLTLNSLRALLPGEISSFENLIAYEEYKYTYFTDYIKA